ncbi:MAG TPA: tRNA (adenosine(37)-N6)-threonylcarbamoyltransferase complex ATPase subunit type 1 TsaE [Gammaproteobacteria bacterium]
MPVFELQGEAEMLRLGGALAAASGGVCSIYLSGPLGAGKTTLVRGFLHALGHKGAVKSPTYTLVEPYQLLTGPCFHFDLYRLNSAAELEAMGIRDYFTANACCLVEWAERGKGVLPEPDLAVEIEYAGSGRRLNLYSHTARGKAILSLLNS